MANKKSKRGLASMSLEKRRKIASMGGKASPTNFKNRPLAELKAIARKGGKASRGGKGK